MRGKKSALFEAAKKAGPASKGPAAKGPAAKGGKPFPFAAVGNFGKKPGSALKFKGFK